MTVAVEQATIKRTFGTSKQVQLAAVTLRSLEGALTL